MTGGRGDPATSYDEGIAAYASGSFADAVALLEQAAEQLTEGSAEYRTACYCIGRMYHEGLGTERSPRRAASWYGAAMDAEPPDPNFGAARSCRYKSGCYEAAAEKYRALAERDLELAGIHVPDTSDHIP